MTLASPQKWGKVESCGDNEQATSLAPNGAEDDRFVPRPLGIGGSGREAVVTVFFNRDFVSIKEDPKWVLLLG